MKTVIISDNRDTFLGMRLAGIGGYYVEEPGLVADALNEAAKDPDVRIVLITERCAGMIPDLIFDTKKKKLFPLITIIPDRHGYKAGRSKITSYISEAVGL